MSTDLGRTRVERVPATADNPPSGPAFTWLFALRAVFTIVGAALYLVAAFTEWTNGYRGNDVTARLFYTPDFHAPANFLFSGAMVAVVLAILALAGLAAASGWPTRLAGALGLIGFALLVVQLYRWPNLNPPQDIGLGMWLILAGGLAALAGGVVGTTFPRRNQSRTIVVD